MVKVEGADTGSSADGIGELASSTALDTAFAVYAEGQLPTKPLTGLWGPVSDKAFHGSDLIAATAGQR